MPHLTDPRIVDQAVAWHLRLKDGDEDAWLEFTDWLEADPAHNAAYDAVLDQDERMASALWSAVIPDDNPDQQVISEWHEAAVEPQVYSRRGAWRWGALAASAALVGVLAFQLVPAGSDTYSIETAPGETRTVALSDGSEIMLNGGTKMTLDRSDERSAELLSGEARFTVTHDERSPFTVTAGQGRVVDVGTVFNVVQSGGLTRVAVAEGAVRYEGASRSVKLRPGDALSTDAEGNVALARKPTSSIGSWAEGALVYDGAPLSLVTEDLSRALGVTLVAPPAMQSRKFSGVIQTDGGKDEVRARLEYLLGSSITANGSNWTVNQ